MSLPELIQFTGNWESYVECVYQAFLDDIVNSDPMFQGLPVRSQYRPPTQNKHFGFWHLISEGAKEEERIPDLRRCERIRWINYLITNAERVAQISWWENRRGSNTHVVIWHELENFVVILAKRNRYYLLKTAYCAERNRSRRFAEERDKFWESQTD